MEIKKGTFCSQNIFKFFLFSFPGFYVAERVCVFQTVLAECSSMGD